MAKLAVLSKMGDDHEVQRAQVQKLFKGMRVKQINLPVHKHDADPVYAAKKTNRTIRPLRVLSQDRLRDSPLQRPMAFCLSAFMAALYAKNLAMPLDLQNNAIHFFENGQPSLQRLLQQRQQVDALLQAANRVKHKTEEKSTLLQNTVLTAITEFLTTHVNNQNEISDVPNTLAACIDALTQYKAHLMQSYQQQIPLSTALQNHKWELISLANIEYNYFSQSGKKVPDILHLHKQLQKLGYLQIVTQDNGVAKKAYAYCDVESGLAFAIFVEPAQKNRLILAFTKLAHPNQLGRERPIEKISMAEVFVDMRYYGLLLPLCLQAIAVASLVRNFAKQANLELISTGMGVAATFAFAEAFVHNASAVCIYPVLLGIKDQKILSAMRKKKLGNQAGTRKPIHVLQWVHAPLFYENLSELLLPFAKRLAPSCSAHASLPRTQSSVLTEDPAFLRKSQIILSAISQLLQKNTSNKIYSEKEQHHVKRRSSESRTRNTRRRLSNAGNEIDTRVRIRARV